MSRQRLIVPVLFAGGVAMSLTGCADDRLNGGYSGETRTMTRLTAPPQKMAPLQTPTAKTDSSQFVYRGGRDPVTGKAYLSY